MKKYRVWLTGQVSDWIEVEADAPIDAINEATDEFRKAFGHIEFSRIDCDHYEAIDS